MKDLRRIYREEARGLLEEIKNTTPLAFKKTLFLSVLGARICYAETPPLSLFAEERFRDPAELKAFFLRLKRAGHGSVFAHSPLIWSLSEKTPSSSLLASLYKAWFDPESGKLQLNLRHFAELLGEKDFEALIAPGVEDRSFMDFKSYYWEVSARHECRCRFEGPFRELLPPYEEELGNGLFAVPRIILIEIPHMEPFGWYAVIVEGFSRLFSHQFVRHTWLNFNQRSHRYTRVDQFVLPPSFEMFPEARDFYQKEIERGLLAYQHLISQGIKKEDARFVTPQGASTTLLATGPYFVWKDFIEKRSHPKAQWEIRQLAQALGEVIK